MYVTTGTEIWLIIIRSRFPKLHLLQRLVVGAQIVFPPEIINSVLEHCTARFRVGNPSVLVGSGSGPSTLKKLGSGSGLIN